MTTSRQGGAEPATEAPAVPALSAADVVADALRRRASYDDSPVAFRGAEGRYVSFLDMAHEVECGSPLGRAFVEDVLGACVRIIRAERSDPIVVAGRPEATCR